MSDLAKAHVLNQRAMEVLDDASDSDTIARRSTLGSRFGDGLSRPYDGEVRPSDRAALADNVVDHGPQAIVMRSPPVDSAAVRAPSEIVVVASRTGRQPLLHLGLGDVRKSPVALEAPAEGFDGAEELEPPEDLHQLSAPGGLPHERASGDGGSLQEAAVPGEQDAILAPADSDQLIVAGVVAPPHVEAEQPQVAGQPPEVDVEDEGGPAEWRRVEVDDGRQVHGSEQREHVHPGPVRHLVGEVDRLAVHHNDVDLGVGHAERLHQVLDGRTGGHVDSDSPASAGGRQEVVQVAVDPDLDTQPHGPGATRGLMGSSPSQRRCGRPARPRRWAARVEDA